MNILYDLDGTISDPFEGITKSINYALSKLGHSERKLESLSKYIGPSLTVAFTELLKTNDEEVIAEAIRLYRERYTTIGFKENTLYPGISATLSANVSRGHRQFIATSKREDIAASVINHFSLGQHFERIYGCDIGRSKVELVAEILEKQGLDRSKTVIVGNRSFDMEAGAQNRIETIGALWGYGSEAELSEAGATFVVKSINELANLLQGIDSK